MQCAVAGVVLLTGLLPVCVFLTGLCWPWLQQILCCLSSAALPPSHVCRVRTVYSLSGGSLHCVFVVSSCEKKKKGWTDGRTSINSAVNKTLKQVKISPLHKLWHQLMGHVSCVGCSSSQAPSGLLLLANAVGVCVSHAWCLFGNYFIDVLMSVDILSSYYWKGNRPCLQPPVRRRQVIKMEQEEGSDICGATSHCGRHG